MAARYLSRNHINSSEISLVVRKTDDDIGKKHLETIKGSMVKKCKNHHSWEWRRNLQTQSIMTHCSLWSFTILPVFPSLSHSSLTQYASTWQPSSSFLLLLDTCYSSTVFLSILQVKEIMGYGRGKNHERTKHSEARIPSTKQITAPTTSPCTCWLPNENLENAQTYTEWCRVSTSKAYRGEGTCLACSGPSF